MIIIKKFKAWVKFILSCGNNKNCDCEAQISINSPPNNISPEISNII